MFQISDLSDFSLLLNNRNEASIEGPGGGGGTPIHYLDGYVPPKGVVILKLLI